MKSHYVLLSLCVLVCVDALNKDQAIQFFHEVNKAMRAHPQEVPQWRKFTLAGKAPPIVLLESTQIGKVYQGLAKSFEIPVRYLLEEALEFLGHKEIYDLVHELKEIVHPVNHAKALKAAELEIRALDANPEEVKWMQQNRPHELMSMQFDGYEANIPNLARAYQSIASELGIQLHEIVPAIRTYVDKPDILKLILQKQKINDAQVV